MTARKEYGDYIQDIVDSITEASEFVHGMSYDVFSVDKKTINALSGALRSSAKPRRMILKR